MTQTAIKVIIVREICALTEENIMTATLVFVDVKPDCIEAFRAASVKNHECSRKEPKNVRFDVLQDDIDPTQFVLFEVYADEEGAKAHKETAHYKAWRDEVAAYMNSPRRAIKTTPTAFD